MIDPISLLSGVAIGIASIIFPAYTCEKEVAFHRENTPKLEQRIAELEKEKLGSVGTIARLEHEVRVLKGVGEENTQLRQENGTFREQLATARQQHQTLITSQAKVSKDTQADLEDRGKWFDKELQKRQDLVDNTNITRWHEKTEYGKKLAEYQRLLKQASGENGKLKAQLKAKEAELATERDTLSRTQLKLTTAGQDLDKMRQIAQKDLDEKDAKHQEELRRYRLAVTGLGAAFFITLVVLVFVLLNRRKP